MSGTVYSRVYTGEVMHARRDPRRHVFRYPMSFFLLDLGELERLDRELAGFSHNRRNRLALFDRDHLRGEGSIREKLQNLLADRPWAGRIRQVLLLTNPRYRGRVFNPVSFYYCLDGSGGVLGMVAEVNNTFNQRHLYVLDRLLETEADGTLVYEHPKRFHVSPFNNMEGVYRFRFSPPGEEIRVEIQLKREGKRVLTARLSGRGEPLTAENLEAMLRVHPRTPLYNGPRILREAARLRMKGLTVFVKPEHMDRDTTVRKIRGIDRFAMNRVLGVLDGFQKGQLETVLPDGAVRRFGDPKAPVRRMQIHSPAFFRRVLRYGDIGFGEAYTDGLWDTDDLTGLLELFLENGFKASDQPLRARSPGALVNWFQHRSNRNSLRGSARNIEAHYDLSNDFFRCFLDPTMTYSCALFEGPDDSLEEAQRRKIHTILDRARIGPEDHLLEIGSGWGTLAIEAVRRFGCRVTTITLSRQQHRLVTERIRREGLEDWIDVRIEDYRTMEGQFDRIVSVEMFEAVGHAHYGTFFASLDRLLAPGGRVVMQVITIADGNYEAYRKGVDWIQKYIFPGGLVPSVTAMLEAMTRSSGLTLEQLDSYGQHYGETLRRWREAFREQSPQVELLGFDERFRRIWEYYLCYCEAGFNRRALNLVQLVLARALEPLSVEEERPDSGLDSGDLSPVRND